MSAAVSAFTLLVALASPRTPLWPFVVANWLIFVPGMFLVMRNANNESGDPHALRSLVGHVMLALLAFAICGSLALYASNSLIRADDLLARSAGR